jgi:hypothetical protein
MVRILRDDIIDRMTRDDFAGIINPEKRCFRYILAEKFPLQDMSERGIFMEGIPRFSCSACPFQEATVIFGSVEIFPQWPEMMFRN